MPGFVCRTCGKGVSYGLDEEWLIGRIGRSFDAIFPFVFTNTLVFDQWLYNQTGGECLNCYSVIARQIYPRNIIMSPCRKACTVFSSMGQSLGDRVMQQVIRDRYVADNPDEEAIFLEGMEGLERVRRWRPLKVFWANLFTGGQEWVPRDAYWFAVTNEATEFARQGHYSRLWFSDFRITDDDSGINKMRRYVVMHLRNQIGVAGKDEKKNIRHEYTYSIFKLLQNRFRCGVIDGVVLVGNDSEVNGYDVRTILGIIGDSLPIVDLRNRWQGEESLRNIAAIAKGAVMGIGRDSGLVQLFGAVGCPKLVAWDFVTEGWFPKVRPGVLSAWVARESSVDKVLEAINWGLK